MPAARISVGFVVKPLINGSAARLAMPASSAPSAKILVRRSISAGTVPPSRYVRSGPLQDLWDRLGQGANHEIGDSDQFPIIVELHQHGRAARPAACVDTAPAVT